MMQQHERYLFHPKLKVSRRMGEVRLVDKDRKREAWLMKMVGGDGL